MFKSTLTLSNTNSLDRCETISVYTQSQLSGVLHVVTPHKSLTFHALLMSNMQAIPEKFEFLHWCHMFYSFMMFCIPIIHVISNNFHFHFLNSTRTVQYNSDIYPYIISMRQSNNTQNINISIERPKLKLTIYMYKKMVIFGITKLFLSVSNGSMKNNMCLFIKHVNYGSSFQRSG